MDSPSRAALSLSLRGVRGDPKVVEVVIGRSDKARREFEKLNVDTAVPAYLCGVCRKEPNTALYLELEDKGDGSIYKITICRDCLSEFTPTLLEEIESAV